MALKVAFLKLEASVVHGFNLALAIKNKYY